MTRDYVEITGYPLQRSWLLDTCYLLYIIYGTYNKIALK